MASSVRNICAKNY